MSYILDALKKADAERAHGKVPGLHTQSTQAENDAMPLGPPTPPWVMGAVIVLALLGLGAAWTWLRPSSTVPLRTAVVEVGPSALPSVQPAPSMQPVAPSPVSVSRLSSAVDQMVQSRPEDLDSPSPVARPAPRGTTSTPKGAPANTLTQVAIHVDPAPRTTASSAPLLTLSELPEDVRRQLPVLAVSGAMYSDQPASRMLLINNRVFHEGDQPITGLVLEEIRLKYAVFRFQGQRFSVNY